MSRRACLRLIHITSVLRDHYEVVFIGELLRFAAVRINFYREAAVFSDLLVAYGYLPIAGRGLAERVKINRLTRDHLVEKVGEFVDNGTTKAVFKKTGRVMA